MKKLAAALLLSSGLAVAGAPAALADRPDAACNPGTMRAHHTVPEANTTAHESIPHCH